MDTVDYGYFGPCGLWMQRIMGTLDHVDCVDYGIIWILWIMDTVDYGYSGLWVLWTLWIKDRPSTRTRSGLGHFQWTRTRHTESEHA